MVDPADIGRILSDAAGLVRGGEIVVFGSAALALWLDDAPATRVVDVWCAPADRGELVEALMGEGSWYHDKHGAYVEVWAPETFAAPVDWRSRARELTNEDHPGVTLIVPHPHDILFAKLERLDPHDLDHVDRILRDLPLDEPRLHQLAANAPSRVRSVAPDRAARFESGVSLLERKLRGAS